MAQALYRKYRPQSFEDIINQEHVTTTLQNELKSGNIAHAYLFSGPRGIGKTSIARLLAKQANAESITKHDLENAELIDIIEIDAASHTGVDNVRENIIQNAYAAPTQLTYKVFIIDEVHMLSVSAFNALLKILEEPPKHVLFILATTEIHKIPATVISRCQRFDFHAIGLKSIVKRLTWICQQEGIVVPEQVLQRIARRAGGAIRDAESMLGQIVSIVGEGESATITEEQADIVLPRVNMTVVVDLFSALVKKQASHYLATIAEAVQTGMHLQEMNTTLLNLLRQCLHYSVDNSLEHFAQLDTHEETHQTLVDLMENTTTQDIVRLIELFSEAGTQLSRAVIPQLPLEIAGITWCRVDGVSAHTVTTSTPPAATAAPQATPIEKIEATSQEQPVEPKVKSVEQQFEQSLEEPTYEPIPEPVAEPVVQPITEEPVPDEAIVAAIAEQPIIETPEPVKEEVVQPIAEDPASAVKKGYSADDSVLFASIKEQWKDVSGLIREHNHALAMSLSLAVVVSMSDNTLLLGTKYEFHKKRIMDLTNLEAIHTVLNDITGSDISVECTVGKEYEMDVEVLNTLPSDNIAQVEKVDNVWDLALNAFGGEEA